MQYVIKSADATRMQEHDISVFTEYPVPAEGLAMGVSEIHGRYPQSGADVDTQIEQIWYVLEGSGALLIENEAHEFAAGDMVYVPKDQPYAIEGNMKLLVASSPAWTPEQHKHLAVN